MRYSYDDMFDLLEAKDWKFAKTYAHKAPHWYTLREKWGDDPEFDKIVIAIREEGKTEYFWRKPFTVWEHKGWKYWTMGAPIDETILINKSFSHTQYNDIADYYDMLFNEDKDWEENRRVWEMLERYIEGKHVYDIGCGTGLFLDMSNVFLIDRDRFEGYCGIDPSRRMIEIARERHKGKRFNIDRFETYRTMIHKDKPTVVVSLYGSMNYVIPQYLTRVGEYADSHFLMFYKEDYEPVTYERVKKQIYHHKHTREFLEMLFCESNVIEFNNYYIVTK